MGVFTCLTADCCSARKPFTGRAYQSIELDIYELTLEHAI